MMKQTLIVLDRAGEDEEYLMREGDPKETYLVRTPTGKGPKFRWKDYYLIPDPLLGERSYAVNISAERYKELSGLPEASQELQIDLFMLPAPVREKGGINYFPFVLRKSSYRSPKNLPAERIRSLFFLVNRRC